MRKSGKKILQRIDEEIKKDSENQKECAYNDGGTYKDGYGDSRYGDYDDHACDWHEYHDD